MATQQNSAVSSQANATFEIKAHMVDYFRRHLLPAAQPPPTPQAAAPPVRYYRMGAVGEEDPPAPGNDWREASDWPIPGGREKTPFGGRKVLHEKLSFAKTGSGQAEEKLTQGLNLFRTATQTAFYLSPDGSLSSSLDHTAQVRQNTPFCLTLSFHAKGSFTKTGLGPSSRNGQLTYVSLSQQAGFSPVRADPFHPADTGTGSSAFAGARDARPFEESGAAGSVRRQDII
jgi:hypothetical protein